MNVRLFFIVAIFLIVVLIIFLAWHYFFSIYEVYYQVTPKFLYSDNFGDKANPGSEIEIKSIPLNALGVRIPYRTSPVVYEIQQGENLIDILEFKPEEGLLRIKAKGYAGTVTIKIKAKYALLPTIIEIPIISKTALKK